MTASYRKIDYRIRPSKHVERIMMCEAFRRLRFGSIESYQYVGLGSVYFSDFSLFHRALGIRNMFSIEKEIHDKQRFLLNRPFSNIHMLWGSTTTELPKIDFSSRSIVWLDYDGTLSASMLEDMRSVASKCSSGSVIAISVQCNPSKYNDEDKRKNVTELAKLLGANRVDPTIDDEALISWGTAKTYRNIFDAELKLVLADRNGALRQGQKFLCKQIFNFHYQDGANMLTLGWVIFDEGQKSIFDLCDFSGLDFIRTEDEAFKINIPKLTSTEVRSLLNQLPLIGSAELDVGATPPKDAQDFSKIYRYFPNISLTDFS